MIYFVAGCSDTGKGGQMDIHVVKGKDALFEAAEKYTKSLPALKVDYSIDLHMHLRFFIAQLVNADIEEKEFKKSVKKLEPNNIVFGKSKKNAIYGLLTK